MIPYIRPEVSVRDIVRSLLSYRRKAKESLEMLKRLGAKSLYIREKQRYCLCDFLMDMGWTNENILLPGFTCDSVAEAVRESGNTPLFYDITPDFEVDKETFEKEAAKGIKAVILSDVYGINMDISPYRSKVPAGTLIIADFAHREYISFDVQGREYIDVIMFSSAYYKPIPSCGIGILAVVSDKVTLQDSIQANYSLFMCILACIRLLLIDVLLISSVAGFAYQFSRRKGGKNDLNNLFDKANPALAISLVQISKCFSAKREGGELYDLYSTELNDLEFVRPTPKGRMTYCSFLVNSAKKNEIHSFCLKKGLLLGNIFGDIAGKGHANCPNANFISKKVLNLPYLTSISKKEKQKAISIILDAQKYA